MDYSAGSFFSSWPANSASENYSFVDGSVGSYAEEGSMKPAGYFMRAGSDHNLMFNEHEKNPTVLTNGCLPYSAQTDLLSSEILSTGKPSNSIVEFQQFQGNGNLQSNLIPQGTLHCNPTPGTFDPPLDTSGLLELPHALSSSIESNDSEISAFLADVQAVSSASTLCSTFQNVSSYMEPVNVEAFGFQGVQSAAMFNKTSHSNGNLPVFDKAPVASIHDCREFLNGSISSFATAQQSQLATGGFKAEQQEQNTMCNIPLPSFVSGGQMAVTEAQQITSLVHNNKSEYPVPIGHSSDVQPQANSAHGNSVSAKPRSRARRGQATDPHSIAERLRREKISERMKNLQELVPNSNKADKSSMLDEIIDYVKFLQLQVKVLSMSRLGAPGAVLPLLRESQTEGHSNSSLSGTTTSQGLLDVANPEDSVVFEQEVIKLMETSITSAMQYLQNKGLCLMPIALASAISNQKGVSAAAIPPEQ
ncbi:uncharacterized protein LOC100841109 [Brachypodium distachyon]|uniref:BHLH domain-containing protein n=1 Tax=Brachypodium distachyon TaxID=15368 RepID=I1H042_BRADI|nr:uncharacterized protein LOC100841109 [Brachypodium distachyon]KQK19168.1 hypothetical protein BRADI_1g46700v3 [Brachypodium distachyon]KQK19169.1 hypothetical protein BRADI_1g46700v3 [Brachypodium distachyon]|eukprot:XP_010227911.1 uncharacterized protein LOC100841109 [Brachypodium distachyon]